MSGSWIFFTGQPSAVLHAFVEAPRAGGFFYLLIDTQGPEFRVRKMDLIASPAEVDQKYRGLYAPLAQGGLSESYVVGRGKRDDVVSPEHVPGLVREIRAAYFDHFSDQLEDDEDLGVGLGGQGEQELSVVEIESPPAPVPPPPSAQASRPSPPPAKKDAELEEVFFPKPPASPAPSPAELVPNPFREAAVPKLATRLEEFRERVQKAWSLPPLAYDPQSADAILAFWQNFAGVPLAQAPGSEADYLFLFTGLLEEIVKQAVPYLPTERLESLRLLVAQVRREKRASQDDLTPFLDAIGWIYLGLVLPDKKGKGAPSPVSDARMASLVHEAVRERPKGDRGSLRHDPKAHAHLKAGEVWAFYANHSLAPVPATGNVFHPDFALRFNETLLRETFSLPREKQTREAEAWKEAFAHLAEMVRRIAHQVAVRDAESG
ncbi:MAG: hypothetical protein AB1405_04655 [Bdellovibrionota bacterium]